MRLVRRKCKIGPAPPKASLRTILEGIPSWEPASPVDLSLSDMSKLLKALAVLALCAVPMRAGSVEYAERFRWFAFAQGGDPLGMDQGGQTVAGAALGFGSRTEYFRASEQDASTGYFLTPTFFGIAFWGFGFQAFDFGDSGWGWGWGWSGSYSSPPEVTCFGGFCREAAPGTPSVAYLTGSSDPGPPALGLSTPPPTGPILPGSLPPADEPLGSPEPGTFALLGAGLAIAVLKRRVR